MYKLNIQKDGAYILFSFIMTDTITAHKVNSNTGKDVICIPDNIEICIPDNIDKIVWDAEYVSKEVEILLNAIEAYSKDDLDLFIKFLKNKNVEVDIEELIQNANRIIEHKFKIGTYLMSLNESK